MPYTDVIFMSYAVPTFQPTPMGDPAAPEGVPEISLGNPDLQARAQRLVNVLYWAQERFSQGSTAMDGMQRTSVLKIFIVPEFYFRNGTQVEMSETGSFGPRRNPDGTPADPNQPYDILHGSYPEKYREPLAAALHAAIDDDRFADWIVVAGTIFTYIDRFIDGVPAQLNTAVLVRGPRSVADNAANWVLMEKHIVSLIDGPNPFHHANQIVESRYHPDRNPEWSWDNVIQWDGMSIGVEVCLDHDQGILCRAIRGLRRVLIPPPAGLDIQLITSCGMVIDRRRIAVREGGLILLTDGMPQLRSAVETPVTEYARVVAGGDVAELVNLGYPTPPLNPLPDGTNYRVNYPNYRGGQGVYAFPAKRLLAV